MTALWAAVYGAFGLACALHGTPLFHAGSIHGTAALDWAVVTVSALAALVCGVVVRHGLRPTLRLLLWVLCGLTGIAAFSLLMDVITLMVGQGVDSPVATANRSLAGAGALLLAATARADRRPTTGTTTPPPSLAPAPVQLSACAGTVAFLPYAAMKLVWVSGGTFAGISNKEMIATSKRNGASGIWLTLESWGLDVTVLLAALGTFLLWGLVRPWGQVFPRWTPFLHGRRVPRCLPLTPALIGATTLVPYGLLGLGYCTLAAAGVVTMRQGDAPSSQDALLMGWIGMVAFAVYGVALTIAARSYWLRTRPINQPPVQPD
ncbi:hypothetical protein [Streptomyces sp. CB03911]|uniref:hypothetical protein n=1 Tax=Streptomyces sp. CB03911 TaxID=1804758 RepID=UPI000AB27D5D|nr:hypothetical protein [Streptomyces sp. CB03911]